MVNAYVHACSSCSLSPSLSIRLSFPPSPAADFWTGVLFSSRSLSAGSSPSTSVKASVDLSSIVGVRRSGASRWSSVTAHTRISTLFKTWTCVRIIFSPPNESVNISARAHYRSSYYSALRKHLVSNADTTYPPTLS